jgi:hypothetical protein
MHPGDAKGGIAMDQDREDPGKQEPVTPEGAHGEQFYAILRGAEEGGYTVRTRNYVANDDQKNRAVRNAGHHP